MSNESLINEMDLPLDNPNESLETISRNVFRPLFAPEKFEIRDEIFRDKGIDFTVEIKKESKYTNFKFLVQLKATEEKERNVDGSVSLQLNTSNINYLLNSGMPAFYAFYVKQSNTFFYESLNDFVKDLNEKDANWAKQKSHALRFKKTLAATGVNEMHDAALKKGIFQREINEKLVIQSASVNLGDKILFDGNFNVTGDAEIRNLIENIGLYLINEARWGELLTIHRNASGNIATTSKYNLVLGIANYYSGHLIDALSFFKASMKLKAELPDDLKNHLHYFDVTVRFSLGLIRHSEYLDKIKDFENAGNIGQYIKLENVKRKYFESVDTNSQLRYDQLVQEINDIIVDPNSDNNLQLNARCEMLLIEGSKNNMDHIGRIALVNAAEAQTGVNLSVRLEAMQQYIQAHSNWYKNVQSVKTQAGDTKNAFAFFMACLNEAKVLYESEVCSTLISIEEDRPGVTIDPANKQPLFDQINQNVDNACNFFDKIGHVENKLVTLSLKYEFLHYRMQFPEAELIMKQMEDLVENYELNDQKRRLQHLRNKGTTHEKLKAFLNDINASIVSAKKEYETMRADMVRMDENDRQASTPKESHRIELFPIGHFSFLKEKTEEVLGILNITSDTARQQFTAMLNQGIIPVANIFYNPIVKEGYLNGNQADQGIDSWRNIYRIRKAFFEHQFFRDWKI